MLCAPESQGPRSTLLPTVFWGEILRSGAHHFHNSTLSYADASSLIGWCLLYLPPHPWVEYCLKVFPLCPYLPHISTNISHCLKFLVYRVSLVDYFVFFCFLLSLVFLFCLCTVLLLRLKPTLFSNHRRSHHIEEQQGFLIVVIACGTAALEHLCQTVPIPFLFFLCRINVWVSLSLVF